MTDKRYLTTREVAERFDVSVQTLKRWRKNGTGPRFYRIGKLVRYRPDEIDAFEGIDAAPHQEGKPET